MKPLHIEVIDWAHAAILAAKTPAERLSMVFEAHRTARMLAEAGARWLHPEWTEEQIKAEGTRRLMHHGAG
jgi:hypothetical protein